MKTRTTGRATSERWDRIRQFELSALSGLELAKEVLAKQLAVRLMHGAAVERGRFTVSLDPTVTAREVEGLAGELIGFNCSCGLDLDVRPEVSAATKKG